MSIGEKQFNHTTGQTVLPMCTNCGALVGDVEVHEAYHAGIDAVFEAMRKGLTEQGFMEPEREQKQAPEPVESPKEWADRELGHIGEVPGTSPVAEPLIVVDRGLPTEETINADDQVVVPIIHGGKTRNPTPVIVDL